MPEERYWESLFDVPGILDGLGVDATIQDMVEVGCGYGTFTLPVARRIRGTLYTFDIDPVMVERTQRRLQASAVRNVEVRLRDGVADGFGIPTGVDAVLLFNILHAENPVELLRTAAEAVRPGGRVLAIHWRSDLPTPRGPALSIRPRPEQISAWAVEAGLQPGPAVLLPPWHFGLILRR